MDHLTMLRDKLTTFGVLLDGDVELSLPIAHCGDWTLYDLVDHLGRGNVWVQTAVAEQRGDYVGEPAPKELAEVRLWFGGTCEAILGALAGDPDAEAWTFTRLAPRTVGFWRRRRAQETSMHLWDAENALGVARSFDADQAADGVSEVFELFAARMVERGLAQEPEAALSVVATDIQQSWSYGPGEPVAEVSGPVSDLLLLLWSRASSSDGAFTWHGDRAAGQRVLDGPLVP